MRSPSGCRSGTGILVPRGARSGALRPQLNGWAIVIIGTNRRLDCDTNPDIRRHAGSLADEEPAAVDSETTQISITLERSWG